MISIYSVNVKIIKCLLTGHDLEKIPIPTNDDWGETSPGSVCVRCGMVDIKKEKPGQPTRQDKAKKFYEKYVTHEHFSNSPSGVLCPSPPGPYSPPPPPLEPFDD